MSYQYSSRPTSVSSVLARLIVAAPFALSAEAAFAQSADMAVLDTISVTAKEVAPGGVQIRQGQIDRANATDIKDVFAGESSVNIGGGSDVSRKIYVNGVEDTNLNVKVDGARQVNSAFHHLGTAIYDPGLLKTVRVETGVGPADVGPGALGGSVAFETKDARDILEADQTLGGFAKLHYDTNNHGFSEVLTVAGKHGNFEVLAYGSNDSGDLYEDGDGNEVPGTEPEMRNFLGKVAWSNQSGDRIEFSSSYLKDEGIRPNRANFGVTIGTNPSLQKFARRSYSISYVDENPTDMINPEIVFSYNRSGLTINDLAFGPFTFDLTSETTSYNGKIANTFSNNFGTFHTGSITAGVDFYRDQGRGDISGGFAPAGTQLTNEETSTNVGAFVQGRFGITEDFRVSLGGRYDHQDFEGIDGTDISEGGISANLNAELDFADGFTGYAGAGTTFGGIPLGESAIYNFAGQWTYDGLHNSRSRNYKVGLKVEQGNLSGDINLYSNDIDGSHNRGDMTRNSTLDIEADGINVAAQYIYGDGFVRGTFSHNRVEADDAILATTSASFHAVDMGDTYSAEVSHDFFDYGLRVGATVEGALDETGFSGTKLDSYTILNLSGQWTPSSLEALTVRLDAKNVFDKAYVDRATTGVDSSRVIPFNEPGRAFVITAKLDF